MSTLPTRKKSFNPQPRQYRLDDDDLLVLSRTSSLSLSLSQLSHPHVFTKGDEGMMALAAIDEELHQLGFKVPGFDDDDSDVSDHEASSRHQSRTAKKKHASVSAAHVAFDQDMHEEDGFKPIVSEVFFILFVASIRSISRDHDDTV